MSDKDISLRTLTAKWLKDNGYDGLFRDEWCACLIDDLMPCGNPSSLCQAGYKTSCRCGEGCDFDVSSEKEE